MSKRKPLSPERSLKRRGARFTPRTRFLLLCEGKVTEPEYFAYVRQELRDRLIQIQVAPDTGDPLDLVNAALNHRKAADERSRQARDDNLRFDQVWCIMDVDSHSRLTAACKLAATEGIHLAISNPCFELWALLHFSPQEADITGSAVQARLGAHLPGYKKSLDCGKLQGKYNVARDRAIKLDDKHERNGVAPGSNPSTAVWRLMDELLKSRTQEGPHGSTRPLNL